MSIESENPEENPSFDEEEFLLDEVGEGEEIEEPEDLEDQFVLGDDEDVDVVLEDAGETPTPSEVPSEVLDESSEELPSEIVGESSEELPSEIVGESSEELSSEIVTHSSAATDDEFILEDGAAEANVGGETLLPSDFAEMFDKRDPPARRAAEADREGQILFEQSNQEKPEEPFAPDQEFANDGSGSWGGEPLSADEIGIPTLEPTGRSGSSEALGFQSEDPLVTDSDQEFDLGMEDDELELVEDESELDIPTVEEEAPVVELCGQPDLLEEPASVDLEESDAKEPGAALLAEGDPTLQPVGTNLDPGDGEEEEQAPLEEGDPTLQPAGAGLDPGDGGEEEQAPLEEGDSTLQPAGAGLDPGDGEEEQPSLFAEGDLSHEPAEEEVDEEWAPVASDAYSMDDEESDAGDEGEDSIYAPAEESETADAEAAGPDYSDYEESYVESHHGQGAFGTQPRRRFHLVRMLSGLAAACLLITAGAVVVLKPELLGLRVEPDLVDRVQIAKPEIDLTLTSPPLEAPPVPPAPVPSQPVPPVATSPVPTPPVTMPPAPLPPVPAPAVPPPPEPTPPEPVLVDPDPLLGPELGALVLGETGILIGEFEDQQAVLPYQHDLLIGVEPGSQVFAQLKNGNYFIGLAKKINPPFNITLGVPKGEIVLKLDELRMLAPLGSEEYRNLQESEGGYVRLLNNELLRGRILKYGRDDAVILEMKSNRILIPRSAIEEIGGSTDSGVHLEDSGDMEWVRRLVEEEMVRDTGPVRATEQGGSSLLRTRPLPGWRNR